MPPITLDAILTEITLDPPIINGITLDPLQISGLDFDSEGLSWVFSTTQAFVISDQNGLSDIYLYNSETSNLILISQTEDNTSGQGDSRYPVMNESGYFIAFQSQANNLLADDKNLGSDIFIYTDNSLHRISVAENEQIKAEFTHPAVDGAGLTLLYEEQPNQTNSDIQSYNTATLKSTIITDSSSHYFFPAISRNGRYQAYLKMDTNANDESCSIHWIDKYLETEANTNCGELNINSDALLRFNFDNTKLEWRDSLWADSIVEITNPLIEEGY